MCTRILPLLLLLLGSTAPLTAQSSLFDYLAEQADTVVLEMDTDWRRLKNQKRKKEYQPLVLTLRRPGRAPLRLRGKVRARGHIRLEVCSNPSLKIKLKKADLLAAGFSDLNDLKVVQQCSASPIGQNYLRRERALYGLHRVFSDYYHRTVPVVLQTDSTQQTTSHAFLIEAEEQLAARYDGKILESKRASVRGLRRDEYVNLCLFNYLILNSDWQIFNLHNVEIVGTEGDNLLIPIPYDFDYAGLVGTTYAVQRPNVAAESVQTPVWLGRNITPAELLTGTEHFMSLRLVAEAFVSDHPTLSEREKKRWLRRMADFYATIDSPRGRARLLRSGPK